MKILHDTILDRHFPFRGLCGYCGHPDARHSLWRGMIERLDAGDGLAAVASDYCVPLAVVRRLMKLRPYQRKRRKAA